MSAGKIQVILVLPSGCLDINESSPDMLLVYNACKMHFGKPKCIQEDQDIDTQKTDVVVFEKFEGALYQKVLRTKSVRIIKPLCLMHCINASKPIPNRPSPLVSIALDECIVVSSNLPKEVKKDLKHKVEAMAGIHEINLTSNTTYLITNSVKSEKYIMAAKRGIKIMCVEFIDDLWETSQVQAVHASNARFQKHACPILNNLNISSTGFRADDNKIPGLVQEHGGIYSSSMAVSTTDILICKTTSSAKYKTAIKHKIDCVIEDWLTDSIAAGYALSNLQDYAPKAATSTPTKRDQFIDPNFSTISVIARRPSAMPSVLQVEQTMDQSYFPEHPVVAESNPNKRKSPLGFDDDLVNQLDIKRAKLCGPYLDGCVVYLLGFKTEHHEKLCKIINFSGATRCESLINDITHVIVGNSKSPELKQIQMKNLPSVLVTVNWLVDSMDAQKPMPTDDYLVNSSNSSQESNELSSPLSKKGVNLLRANLSILEPQNEPSPRNVEPPQKENVDDDIMKHYLNSLPGQSSVDAAFAAFTFNNATGTKTKQRDETATKQNISNEADATLQEVQPADSKSVSSLGVSITLEESSLGVFSNLKFAIVNYLPDQEEHIKEVIKEFQGTVVPKNYKGIPDYAVVPIDNTQLQITASQVVTHLWIEDCTEQKQLITDLEYYHTPFPTKCNILDDLVICLSGLPRVEREFLVEVVHQLGGKQQDSLSRNPVASKGIFATTHLIAAEPSGKKYAGAVKWGIPVLNKDWLLKCAEEEKRIDEFDFLIGQSKEDFEMKRKNTKNDETLKLDVTVTKDVPSNFKTPGSKEQELIATPSTARKSLFGVSKVQNDFTDFKTPPNKKDVTFCSQVTPVNEIMKRVARAMREEQTPDKSENRSRNSLDDIKTPDTPLGRCFVDPPPPEERKMWAKWLKKMPTPKKQVDTPLSEIKRRFWANLNVPKPKDLQKEFDGNVSSVHNNENIETGQNDTSVQTPDRTDSENLLAQHMDKLENAIKSSGGAVKRRNSTKRLNLDTEPTHYIQSQTLEIGWNYTAEISQTKPKIFMLSGLENEKRIEITEKLERLGATVSSQNNFDSTSTHLLCDKMNRNEKMLGSIASGLWILHYSYVDDSAAAGKLLNEEDYEFGNPQVSHKFKLSDVESTRASASRYWREEITRRGYAAFNDIRAIIVGNKKEPMIRVLQAGGAVIIDAKPPFADSVSATHCFLESKTPNMRDYVPLAKQGVKCFNIIYINDFLTRQANDIKSYIFPEFEDYY